MILNLIRARVRHLCLFVLICALMVALTGFGGSAQSDPSTAEPDAVGRVTNLVASTEGQEAGAVQLTWTPAENAQVHFVVYVKSADWAAGNYGAVQMVSFHGTQGVINGLEGGTSYDFIAIGMRWNWVNYGTVWGGWSEWTSATPSMGSNVDLVVEAPSVNNGSVLPGGSFTLSATVRNQGDAPSGATTLRYYRSTDSTITASDTSVGTDAVGTLAASGASDESIGLTAPSTAGTYYYGACVDAVAGESDTTNNCSSSVQVTVSEPPAGPDLNPYAILVTTNPGGTGPGGNVGLSVGVRNDGDESSAATTVRFYQSTDATITTSDTQVGTNTLGALSPGATASIGATVSAPSTAGTYYYGACVDAVAGESDTTNNCSGSVSVTVEATSGLVGSAPGQAGTAPDLTVGSPSVTDNTPDTGGSLTLSATVNNGGDGSSAATTLRYYRSTDSTITASDTSVGTDAVGTLAASGASDESIGLTAPSTAGTYYYGACVDAVAGESDTTNNCSSSVQVTVSEPPAGPDLNPYAILVTTNPGGTGPGGNVGLSVGVRNDGDESSAATTVRFYQSTDATITTSDTQVGTNTLGALSPGATASIGATVSAPSTAGTYYYGACVDAVAGESDTTNNCSSSVQVVVSEPPVQTSPDLTVGSPSVTDNTPSAGGSLTLSATVRNQGDGSSAATTLRYYRSTDSTITASDTAVGTDAVGTLAASGSSSESIGLTASASAGTYYYGACVDTVSGESDTNNNCSGSVQVTVSEPPAGPDLDPYAIVVTTNPGGTGPGGNVGPSVGVRNDGDESSAATTVRFYQSTDATITTADTEVGTSALGALSPGATASVGATVSAPLTPGTYYYGACVDTVSGESDTTNNCSGSVQVIVSEPPVQTRPDLTVGTPTASDSTPSAGGSFTLSATVRNRGDGSSAATTLRYYRSTDSTITTSDTSVGTDAVSTLAASGTSAESIDLTAPSDPGTYYYGACVDTVSGESDTTNNCSGSVSITVSAITAPDLAVGTPTVSDSTPSAGGSLTLSATVRNQGDGSSAATTLRYYRSTDSTITTSDTSVGTDAVGTLAASGSSSESIGLTASASAGTYYYGACVDTVSGESDTTNNCSGSVQVTVSAAPPPTGPDLRVYAILIANTRLSAGVGNYGDVSSAATTLRFYWSTDATITTSDTEVGTDAIGALSAGGRTSSAAIDFTRPSTPGTYYYGACVDTVSGESDTTNNCSGSLSRTVSDG